MAERTYTEPPEEDDEEPVTKTVWRLVRAFVPPSRKPGIPYVTPIPEHEGDEPPPAIDLLIQFNDTGTLIGEWPPGVQGLEVWVSEDGQYFLLSRITNPNISEMWIRGNDYVRPTAIQVRFRFFNDAGPGPWGDESPVTLRPAGRLLMLATIEVMVNRTELTEDGQVRVWCRPVTPEGAMTYPEHPPFSVPAGTEPGLGTRITITYALKEGA